MLLFSNGAKYQTSYIGVMKHPLFGKLKYSYRTKKVETIIAVITATIVSNSTILFTSLFYRKILLPPWVLFHIRV